MPCFVSSESNLKKQDPDPAKRDRTTAGLAPLPKLRDLGVIIAVTIIITMGSRISQAVFELFKLNVFCYWQKADS